MRRPIAISLSPNTQKDDVLLAIKTMLQPWNWRNKSNVRELERDFEKYFESYGGKALAVNSGRSALYLILKALGIGMEDEVVLQAFTCVAVSNSISWLGASPVYVDIDDSFNIDAKDLKKKLSRKTKALIIQNTFGTPADYEKITKTVRSYNKDIVIIEDCAHSLGASYKGEKIGTLADISFFSFGRDKIISSVFGGMIMTKDKKLYEKIKALRDNTTKPSMYWCFQQLMHPILFNYLILPLYNFGIGKYGIGKVILFLSQRLGLLSNAVFKEEKQCGQPVVFPAKMPGALAILARNQLKKLDTFNKHRRKIAAFYQTSFARSVPLQDGAIYLRYPYTVKTPKNLFNELKKKDILVGDWYKEIIAPLSDVSCSGYKVGSCPKAEELAVTTLNLPTYPTFTDGQARLVVEIITKWRHSN